VVAYYATLGRLTVGSRTVELALLRGYARWAVRERIIASDPTVRIDQPRQHRRLPRPIPEGRLHAALAAADPQMRAILTLAAFAGLRACEIARLDRAHVMELLPEPSLLVADGKGGHQRLIPMHPAVIEALRDLPMPASGPLLRRADGRAGHNLAARLSRRGCDHLRSVGIPDTLHSLRHRFGTQLYRGTQDLRLTQELLGHASPATTALYAAADMRKASAAVHALGGAA
jgi:integrase/recombinase XerC